MQQAYNRYGTQKVGQLVRAVELINFTTRSLYFDVTFGVYY